MKKSRIVKLDVYSLYCHITPNNEYYVGVTSRNPYHRWNYGNGYTSKNMRNVIDKYGWENIQHIIIEENLTYEDASTLEHQLIKELRNSGFNILNKVNGGGITRRKMERMFINCTV